MENEKEWQLENERNGKGANKDVCPHFSGGRQEKNKNCLCK